jgi:hypothetical protein
LLLLLLLLLLWWWHGKRRDEQRRWWVQLMLMLLLLLLWPEHVCWRGLEEGLGRGVRYDWGVVGESVVVFSWPGLCEPQMRLLNPTTTTWPRKQWRRMLLLLRKSAEGVRLRE